MIKGSERRQKKYYNLEADGLEIINDLQNSSFSSTQEARRAANKLSKNFVDSLPLLSTAADAERPRAKWLREKFQKIMDSWKFEGARVELSEDGQYAYLRAALPFTRSSELKVCIYNGNREENASAANSSSSSSSAFGLDEREKSKRGR